MPETGPGGTRASGTNGRIRTRRGIAAGAARPRSRTRTAIAVPVVVGLGLVLRFGVAGAVGDLAGGALYAVLVFLLMALVAPAAPAWALAALALAVCVAVELLQLSGLPSRLADAVPGAALVLGRGFAISDLCAYAVGVGIGVGVDRLLRPPTCGLS